MSIDVLDIDEADLAARECRFCGEPCGWDRLTEVQIHMTVRMYIYWNDLEEHERLEVENSLNICGNCLFATSTQ